MQTLVVQAFTKYIKKKISKHYGTLFATGHLKCSSQRNVYDPERKTAIIETFRNELTNIIIPEW